MAGDMNPYACWLAGIEGVGNKTIRALLTRTNGAEEIFGMPEEEIAEILGSEMKKRQAAEKTAAKIASTHGSPIGDSVDLPVSPPVSKPLRMLPGLPA